MIYGSENWLLTVRQKKRMEATEMKMLRVKRAKKRPIKISTNIKNYSKMKIKIARTFRKDERRQVRKIWRAKTQGKNRRGR